ncbi:MAG: hypothetical protein mread185_000177 [Mycoplasmataceae bacterium]|nr:MAG: hypothetical protein mread185_000177 [Mycoplasmataceae bacterium]
MTETNKVSLNPIISARNFLAGIIKEAKNDYEKAGAIQSFEICYELSWHFCQKILSLRNIRVFSPKETFRAAGLERLIEDPEAWFDFGLKRNLTTHTYDGKIALEILEYLPKFLAELDKLIKNLKEIEECYYDSTGK